MIIVSTFVLAVLAWDVFLAGQIAQSRAAAPVHTVMCGFAALLLAPAMLVNIADAGGIGLVGHTLSGVSWVWAATVGLFTVQALYATTRRLVTPVLGVPIILFDILLLLVAVTRYSAMSGGTPPAWTLTLVAAYVTAISTLVGTSALSSPYIVLLPMIVPAFPARWSVSKAVRAAMALAATAGVVLTLVSLPYANRAVRSYDRYVNAPFQPRAAGDFAVGIRLLPPVTLPPTPQTLRNDLELVDTTGAEAVSVVINPEGTRPVALDSLAHTLDSLRRDSTLIIVALGYPRNAALHFHHDPRTYDAARLADIDRIVRRIDPDYLLPADAPTLIGAHALHGRPIASWERYFTQAADLAHRFDRRIKVGVEVQASAGSDSTLYAWATSANSPLDVVGFTFYPGIGGANTLDARLRTADRWLNRTPEPHREHWVFSAGGYPMAHGELSQARAVWGTIAWATAHPAVKGVVVGQPADYGTLTGLRAADGRLRPVVTALARATQAIRDSAE